MVMPGTGPRSPGKKYRKLDVAIFLLLIAAMAVSIVAAEVPGNPACSGVDQLGNPACHDLPPVDSPAVIRQGNGTETTWNNAGVTGTIGLIKDLFQSTQRSGTELLEIAGSGIKGSLNQTRNAGAPGGSDNNRTGPGLYSTIRDGGLYSVIKGITLELAEIAGLALKNSVNQTIHADNYHSLTDQGTGTPVYTVSDGDDEEPAPNILRVTYANIIRGVLQFIDITPRAIKGSIRNNSTGNSTPGTNRSAGNLGGYPFYASDPYEQFMPELDSPVTRVIKNATPDIPLLLKANTTPAAVVHVQPTPTPVPVPVFNLSVDSEPRGALIVLNGNRTGTTPYVMTGVEKKTYTLTLTRAGYLAYSEVLTLDADKTLKIPLTPAMDALFVTPGKATGQNKYGGIYVHSYPEKLDLSIDGVQVTGGTPFLYYGFPEGLHTIRVIRTDKSSGPATYTRSAWVYHDALTTFTIDTEEVLLPKIVSISPGPYSGAEFTINGRFPPGRLPATISAGCPGSFISVHKGEAYTSFLIPCTNQDTIPMNLAGNEEPHPPLQVSSVPEGSEIFIDGFRTGYTTPHTFAEVSGGLHRIMLSKPGLIPKEEIVAVEIRGANTSPQKVFFTMENYGDGTIVVDSLPRGATIYLNGWTPGESTPHTFDHMKIGFYEVIVQLGPKPWIEQFELIPSKVSKVVADFEI